MLAFCLCFSLFCFSKPVLAESSLPTVSVYLSAPVESEESFTVSLYISVPNNCNLVGIDAGIEYPYNATYFESNGVTVASGFGSVENNIKCDYGTVEYLNDYLPENLSGTVKLFTVEFLPSSSFSLNNQIEFKCYVKSLYGDTENQQLVDFPYECNGATVYYGTKFSVGYSKLTLNPTDTAILTPNKDIYQYKIRGDENVITYQNCVVTAENTGISFLDLYATTGEILTLPVTVTLSDENRLKSISVTNGEISPEFNFNVNNYSVILPYNATEFNYEYLCNSKVTASADKQNPVLLNSSGEATVNITAISQSGKQNVYTLNVKRADPPVDVSKLNVSLSSTEVTYNGKTRTPTVSVKTKSGKALENKKDYTVTYASGRKTVGKYKVTVTFKGNYTGKKELYFKIVPAKRGITKVTAGKKKATVKWKTQTTQTSGYQIQYSTNSKFKTYKTVTVSGNKATTKTVKNLTSKKTYYFRLRTYKTVNGEKIVSGWSTAKKVKIK